MLNRSKDQPSSPQPQRNQPPFHKSNSNQHKSKWLLNNTRRQLHKLDLLNRLWSRRSMSKSPNLPINTQLPYKQKQDKLWQSRQINNMMRKLSRLPVLNLLSAKTNKLRLLNHPMFLRSLLIKSQELKLLPQQSQNKLRHLLLLKFFLKSRQQNKRQKFNKSNLLSDRNMRRPLNRLLSLRNKKSLCR